MVSSVGGSPALQQAAPQEGGNSASVSAIKKSLDVEKMTGQALVDMIDKSAPHMGNSVDIKV